MEDPQNNEIYGLKKAVEIAWDALSKQQLEDIINRALCILGESSETITVHFLGEDYSIRLKERKILTSDGKPFYNLFKIGIMLHYLTHAKENSLTNKLISFRELWGGNEYYPAFNNRVLMPLTDYFKDKPDSLITAGRALGGVVVKKGEYGLNIPALPRVPITVLLWTGDDEVPASANILYDVSANEQMETEGLVWLSIATVGELKRRTKL